MKSIQALDMRAIWWDEFQDQNTGIEWYPGPLGRRTKGSTYAALISNLQREVVGDMEMMSHLGNSKYREPCTVTKFKKKKEKKDSVFEERLLQFVDLQTVKGKKDGQEMLDNFLE